MIQLNIVPSTLWRWQQDATFKRRYREARRAMTERASAILQQASQIAASRLIQMMSDEDTPVQIQYAAAVKVLDFAYRGEEIQDIQASIEELKEMLDDAAQPAKKGLRAA